MSCLPSPSKSTMVKLMPFHPRAINAGDPRPLPEALDHRCRSPVELRVRICGYRLVLSQYPRVTCLLSHPDAARVVGELNPPFALPK